MRAKSVVITFFLSIILLSVVSAEQHLVINSEEWTDVYSGIMYSRYTGETADFLTSELSGSLVLEAFDSEETSMDILSSSEYPFVFNYRDLFESKGFEATENSMSNFNLELIEELPEIKNFVIVSDSYGYSSLAVAPYALKTDSWVFFANERTIGTIDDILQDRDVDNLLIYGYVDSEVRDTLEEYNPETIYTANRFEDNIEIVEKYLEIAPDSKQVILTNGEFIESEMISPDNPVLFTGRQNVPDAIQEYLKEESPLEIGVLIGNELVSAATNIKESTGLYVMVKFARGARVQEAGVSSVEGLDIFPVPSPVMDLQVNSVRKNILTNNLEVTYLSGSNIPIYLKNTMTFGEGTGRVRISDSDAIFVNPESYKTVVYDLDEYAGFDFEEGEIFLIYGETKGSLEMVIEGSFQIESVETMDSCELELASVYYDVGDSEFVIKVKNVAEKTCYAQGLIQDFELPLETITYGSAETISIKAGETGKIKISEEISIEDLRSNELVRVVVNYGEREASLVNSLSEEMELKIKRFGQVIYVAGILVILAIVFFLLFVYWKKREDKEFDI